ncbi:Mn2+/Fe2+ transporter [Natrinema longum]|uniref:Mn2+/Fe2+ transporter n=1 Tax=Natrinema longum TaxID=370324 RepID=A0A8A2U651_9EURY|nr:Mn2+/Fe2+ transporter [Natrinema longum]MBZ6494338.1 Mn2+/Fe2+ transporter [Natrinema longum]QSW84339.1 Mn2+/Fe2+ transporter [Natrinema longum]
MSSETDSKIGKTAFEIIAVFTIIGVIGVSATNEGGTFVTWFWMGIGLAAIYLLYRLVSIAERILDTT